MISNVFAVRGLAAFALLSLSVAACGGSPDTASTDDDSSAVVSKSAHFETFTGTDGKTYFDLVAGNGQNVLRSQGYTTKESASNGIASVQSNGTHPAMFDVKQAANGEYYFNLQALNGAIIGTSETYATKSNADRAATTVRGLIRVINGASAAPRLERFESFKGEDGQSYFHLRAGNGEIVLASQGYSRPSGAEAGIITVLANGVDASNFKIFSMADGRFGFDLVAQNGEVIGRGQAYASQSNAERAVARVAQMLAAGVSR